MRASGVTVLAILAGALLSFLGVTPTAAQTAPMCIAEIGGQSLANADAPERAIVVDADSSVRVALGSTQPVSSLDVAISVWPLPAAVIPLDPPLPTQLWADVLPVAEDSRYGSGLYQVAATTDVPGCEVHGWVNVTGRSPLETPAGWVGLGLVTIGVLAALRAVFSRKAGGLAAVIGGMIAGAGLLVLAQQAGIHAITPQSALIWTAVPGAISGVANAVVGGLTSPAGGGVGAGAPVGAGSRPPVPPRSSGGWPSASTSAPTAPSAPAAPVAPPPQVAPPPPTAAAPSTPMTPPPPASLPAAAAPSTPSAPVSAGTVTSGPPPAGPIAAGGVAAAGSTAGPVTAAGSTVVPDQEPPRTTFASLSCPDAVVVDTAFEVVVGLADRPDPRVVGEAMTCPTRSTAHTR